MGVACTLATFSFAARAEEGSRPNGAARLPDTSTGGDYWELLARFDDGRMIFAQTLLTQLGWGGAKAAVIGAIVQPDGAVLHFRRTEQAGGWTLSDDRRTLDLQAAILEQREGRRRLRVRKSGLTVDVAIESNQSFRTVADTPAGCAMAVLDVSSVARGSIQPAGADRATPLGGRASFTHRWLDQLEANCATRRLELFILDAELGLYYSELLTPVGEVVRWAVLRIGDETVFDGAPTRATSLWSGEAGTPGPESLEIVLGERTIAVDEIGAPLLEMDLLERVPSIFRPVLAMKTQPALRLRNARFEVGGAGADVEAGQALVKVLYLNPLPAKPR